MSWHYLQEQGEFCPDSYLAGLRSERSNLTPIVGTSYFNDNETDSYQLSLFGTTSKPLTGNRGGGRSMWFPGGGRVPIYRQRKVKVKDLPDPVQGYGSRCYALLKKFNLRLSLQKTVRAFVLVDSAPSSKDLPSWGMTFGGVCWELGMSAVRLPHTRETAYGYMLPTPQAMDAYQRGNLSSPSVQRRLASGGQMSLSMVASPKSGRLNPTWVEWLMAWPIHWGDVTASEPLVRDSVLLWLRQHGRYSTNQD